MSKKKSHKDFFTNNFLTNIPNPMRGSGNIATLAGYGFVTNEYQRKKKFGLKKDKLGYIHAYRKRRKKK